MLAAVYHGPQDVRIEDVPVPIGPGLDEVLIDVMTASICGTDLSEYRHGPRMIPLTRRNAITGHMGPIVIGHEFAGTVVSLGHRVDNGLRVGDCVVPGAGSWCGVCPRCLEGRVNLCDRYFVYGLHANGGMAEQAVVPANMCHRIPAECTWESAAMAQPAAIALHAVRRAGPRTEDTVVVMGAGGIGGFIVAAMAAQRPQQLIVVDVNEARLKRAAAIGATAVVDARRNNVVDSVRQLSNGAVADLVVEASGTPVGLANALQLARPGGRVLLVGIQAGPVKVDLASAVVHEVELVTTNGHVCEVDLPAALDLLRNSKTSAALLGDVIPLGRLVDDGLEAMAENRADGKIVVKLNDN